MHMQFGSSGTGTLAGTPAGHLLEQELILEETKLQVQVQQTSAIKSTRQNI